MGLREEKKREQRQAILDTAVELFRQRGFDETRVSDVIDRLRISEATFFNYFPTKQSVLEAAALDLLERVVDLLLQDALSQDRPVAERMEEVMVAWADNFSGDLQFSRMLAMHTNVFLARWSEEQWHERARLPLRRLFEEAQLEGVVRADVPAAQLSEIWLSISLATVSNWLLDEPGGDGLDQRLLRAWRVFRDGALLPKPAG